MSLSPEILLPSSNSADGILPTLPIPELFVEDLLHDGRSKRIVFSCDGANANQAAIRMLTSDLRRNKKLLFTNICAAHGSNNAVRWSLADCPCASMLRAAHVYDAVRNKGTPGTVSRFLSGSSGADQLKPDSKSPEGIPHDADPGY